MCVGAGGEVWRPGVALGGVWPGGTRARLALRIGMWPQKRSSNLNQTVRFP